MNLLLTVAILLQEPTVEQLIDMLRSEKVEDREEATRKLKDVGEKAIPLLEKAAKDSDNEVARRARDILAAIPFEPGKKALEKLEDTLHKARTVRVCFKFDPQPGGVDVPPGANAEGTLLLGGNRTMRLEMLLSIGSEKHRALMVSDGARVGASVDESPPLVQEAPKELHENMVRGLVRAGIFVGGIQRGVQDSKHYLKTNGHQLKQDGPGTSLLTFGLEIPGIGATGDVTLWYDPKTWTIQKRTVAIRQGGQIKYSISEVYKEYVLDPDIPSDAFKIPEAKK